jgi:very-short-patch-repair endonuclease
VSQDKEAHVIVWIGSHSRRGITAHRIELAPDEIDVMAGDLPLTGPRRTAADGLASLPFDRALDLWAWLSSRQVLDHDDLLDLAEQKHGKYGVVQLRKLAEVTATGAVSGAEQRLHELLQASGITGWEAGVTVTDQDGVIGVVDLLFREAKVVVEVDGWRAHSTPEAFQRDRTRQNRLVAAGYIVLRFTWHDLTTSPAAVLAQVRRAIS